jgi:hypothetical protein
VDKPRKRRPVSMTARRFEIEPRSPELGGGWRLRLLEEEEGGHEIEMGGGVFAPDVGYTEKDAYAEALEVGEDWLTISTQVAV